jgi:hypothetical protein
MFSAMGAVVVQADDFKVIFLFQPTGVVLEAEFGPISHLEIGAFTIEAPDYGAVRAVYLVDSTGVPGGYEIIAL